MAVPAGGASKEVAIEGLSKLRTGALMLIIAALMVGAGVTIAIFATLGGLMTGGLAGLLAGQLFALAATLVGVILMLVALFAFVIPGSSRLASWNTEFSTPSKLIKVGLAGGLILMLIALLISIAGASAYSLGAIMGGAALMVIAGIMTFVGYIGIILLAFRLNRVFDESLFMVAGILFIVSIFVGILMFVAWALMFVGLGSAINKLKAKG